MKITKFILSWFDNDLSFNCVIFNYTRNPVVYSDKKSIKITESTESSNKNFLNQYQDEEDKRILEEFYKAGLIKSPTRNRLSSALYELKEKRSSTGKSYAYLMRESSEDKRTPTERVFDDFLKEIRNKNKKGEREVSFLYKKLGFDLEYEIERKLKREGFEVNMEPTLTNNRKWTIYW